MKIVVDENIPNITVEQLQAMGHDVLDIRGTERQGMFDNDLWALAQSEQRTLVTTDKGFSTHRDDPHHGLLVVRLDSNPNRGVPFGDQESCGTFYWQRRSIC